MTRVLFSIFISLSIFSQDVPKTQEETIDLVIGIDKIIKLDFPPSTKIQIGNETILSTQIIPQKRELTLKGQKAGKTSVNIRNTVGDVKKRLLVNVSSTDQSKLVQELREFLGDVEGLEIGLKPISNRVYIGGKIVVPSDIGRIVAVLDNDRYADVVRLVELSPLTQRVIARNMQDEIQKFGIKDVTVSIKNKAFWLEGIVGSEGQRQQAFDIAVGFLPDRIQSLAEQFRAVQTVGGRKYIQNRIQVNAKEKPKPVPKMVKITSQFVELSKSYQRVFGFSWNPLRTGDGGAINIGKGALRQGQTGTGGVSTASEGTLSATISNLFPKLNTAKTAGYARVLQSGMVIIEDGKKGHLEKSTDFKFSTGTGDFARPTSTTVGFTLDVSPQILQEEKIRMTINVQVSATLNNNSSNSQSSNVNTSVVVKSKDSAAIGGIVVNSNETEYDKDAPGATDTPSEGASSLFSFVRSKNKTSKKSQFVVFVTPEIIESASEGTEEIKRKFRRRRR